MSNNTNPFYLILFVFALLLSNVVSANVALSKYRIFFDSNSRSESLQLRNTGDSPIKYTAELDLNTMTEEGSIYLVSEDPFSALDLIRFSPKRGVIQPGERQAIRFALRKPSGLEHGEYRAIVRISSELAPTKGGNVNLASKLAYSIPIIVRHGEVFVESALLEPSTVMHNGTLHVQVWVSRQGNRSLYGNFSVETPEGKVLGLMNNVGVYRPLERRRVLIPLQEVESGPIIVKFTENKKFGGNLVLAIEHNLE